MTTRASMQGHAPTPTIAPGNPEAQKYGRLWAMPEYRTVAPGEALAQEFLAQARPKPGAEVIDFGCGTGRGALMLALLGRCTVTMVDFVRNCLDPEIEQALTTQAHALKFIKADLEQPLPVAAEYGFCTDVMEHIPEDKVGRVLDHILKAARHVFFSIATTEDRCGDLIGERLHLTVQPYSWWLRQLNERDAVIHWSREDAGGCCFYVSAWRTGREIVGTGVLNVEEAAVRANVAHNIAQGWQQVHPHPSNDLECLILGGGPSLDQFTEEIRAKHAAGAKVITLNGTYQWAHARGIWPVNQVMVDARPFNARFVQPIDPACLYFIASQCHPSVLEGLPPARTYLFHTMSGLVRDLLDAQYGSVWHAIPGGSTALLRAIPLMRMLGFSKFHLYGCDSCLMDGAHHAYAQPENDSPAVFPVTTNPGGRVFSCHGWMVSQAQELLDMIRMLGDVIELEIHGDGLLAYLLTTGAALADAETPKEA